MPNEHIHFFKYQININPQIYRYFLWSKILFVLFMVELQDETSNHKKYQ